MLQKVWRIVPAYEGSRLATHLGTSAEDAKAIVGSANLPYYASPVEIELDVVFALIKGDEDQEITALYSTEQGAKIALDQFKALPIGWFDGYIRIYEVFP